MYEPPVPVPVERMLMLAASTVGAWLSTEMASVVSVIVLPASSAMVLVKVVVVVFSIVPAIIAADSTPLLKVASPVRAVKSVVWVSESFTARVMRLCVTLSSMSAIDAVASSKLIVSVPLSVTVGIWLSTEIVVASMVFESVLTSFPALSVATMANA